MGEPRAKTADEVCDEFISACASAAEFWATTPLDPGRDSVRDRIFGALHSWLCIIDGVSGGMPAFDLVAAPHPDDKDDLRSEGENWIEAGTVINDDMLHDLLSLSQRATDAVTTPSSTANSGSDATT